MRIVILGAGIIGVTAAYQLLKDGHAVTIVDKADGPATFTSYGNAGLVAPGHAYAWSSPTAPGMMLRSLWRGDQAIRFKPRLSPRQWTWVGRFLGQCNDRSAGINTGHKARLCLYSQSVLRQVVGETGIDYDAQKGGLIYFYRTRSAFDAAAARAQILRDEGIAIEVLDADQTVARDPGLASARDQLAGALLAPDDESGDCNLFAIALAGKCADLGATFRYGETVLRIKTEADAVVGIETDKGDITADAFVLCLGVFSPDLARQIGLRLPIYPVKGYSATLRIVDRDRAPRFGGVDEENLLAYCPMGARVRVTATAEISDYSNTHKPADFREMLSKAKRLFDGAADFANPECWAGLRPMTPTGVPIIDRSPYANFWLNTGHGHMGWTMANGSAKLLADLVGQRNPEIDREGMRYDA